MIVVLIPLLIAVVIYGGYKLYLLEAALLGVAAASITFTLVIAALVALCAHGWHRHRVLRGRKVDGRRILAVTGAWGRLALNAEEKRGQLTLNGQEVRFIFGDIAGLSNGAPEEPSTLSLNLRGSDGNPWRIPLASSRDARDWLHILRLAAHKKL